MKIIRRSAVFAAVSTLLVGCQTAPIGEAADKDLAQSREQYRTMLDQFRRASDNVSGFWVDDEPAISVSPLSKEEQELKAREWLTGVSITFDPAKRSTITATELLRMFRQQYGINIVTTMPLDSYSYNGLGVTNVDAHTAMTIFLGSMGLDFDIDNERRVVTVEPMRPRTWTLNLGNRRTNFTSGTPNTTGVASTAATQVTASTALGGTTGGFGTTTGTTGTTGVPGATSTSPTSGTPGTSAGASTAGVIATDDFWGSLNREIAARLTVMVPRAPRGGSTTPAVSMEQAGAPMPSPMGGTQGAASAAQAPAASPAPAAPQASGGGQAAGTSMYESQSIGRYSINPETGAIWVQAPKYVLKNIDEYLTKVQEMYNTTITFEGQIVTVTSTKNKSEGIDWTAFNAVANGDFTTVVQNNVLGGVVLSPAGANGVVNSLSIGNTALPGAGSILGVMSASKQFALFNAFLSTVGQVKVLDTPLVTTTSGMPVKFEKQLQRFYQRYSQQAASSGVAGAAIATNTEDVPYNIGMTLRLNPRYDAKTGMVRAQFALERSSLNGFEQKVNVLTTATGAQNVPSRIPILSRTSNDGEILLKDGDMIVVGGLTEDAEENTDSGVTGLMDSPIRALAGKSERNKVSTTYYFAIRASVKRKL